MNLIPVFATGLLAGGVSCAAVQGGLLAGLVMRQRHTSVGGPARSAPAPVRFIDDLTPVGGFLAGKLISHTLLGALLGAVGGVMTLSVGMRTAAQLVAGILIISFGLAQLGVPGFRNIVIEPPASWSRFVRGRARSSSALAPAILGLASILIPCGVTLSVEALALTSGSAWAGAATMAAFVVGTSPLFAVLGYLARRAGGLWRGRLALATGLVVVGLGLFTFNTGLELSGSSLAASRLAETIAGVSPATTSGTDGASVVAMAADGTQQVTVTATSGGYQPNNIRVRSGVPTRLVVRSRDAQGCVRAFVIPETGGQWVLPVNGDTTIDLGVLRPGRLNYSCGMGMYTGRLTVS